MLSIIQHIIVSFVPHIQTQDRTDEDRNLWHYLAKGKFCGQQLKTSIALSWETV